mgnify:CR=1 FL=1
MAREVQVRVLCDRHKEEKNEKVEAEIAMVAIRFNDPMNPGATRVYCGAIDVCTEHQAPFAPLLELLTQHSVPLDEESRKLLRTVVNSSGPGDTGFRLCTLCPRGKVLKVGSLPYHLKNVHEGEDFDQDDVIKKCDENGDVILT